MRRSPLLALSLLLLLGAPPARAFCGFYVGKADSKLFNNASKVVMVHDGNRTVLTMASDYEGTAKDFALVVPVPEILKRQQINVGEPAMVDHLDAYSAPRLVEYFDPNPCGMNEGMGQDRASGGAPSAPIRAKAASANASHGVTIEARYEVGEYDILILSAKESSGLAAWLTQNQYKVPKGAGPVLSSYLKSGMKFFVAKINLGRHAQSGYSFLRPLQVAYESRKFMLPVRLGTVNAKGPQELFIFALTRKGRVETTNYRVTKLPSGDEVPVFVKDDFKHFYKDLFSRQVKKEEMRTVFLEYAWNAASCDPCAAEPPKAEELRKMGAFWVTPNAGTSDVFVTRLHLRYDAKTFPEDLMFEETGNQESFQGRYVIRHAWGGEASCDQAKSYFADLKTRREKEVTNLASLTGWPPDDIRRKVGLPRTGKGGDPEGDKTWYKDLWK